MTRHNAEIAAMFEHMADLLEILGENPFRVRAYRNASRNIYSLSRDLPDMIKSGQDLTEIPGIGDDLAEKIETIVKTGELPALNKLEKRVPSILSELLKIEGLGPKRVIILHRKLKIRTLKDLQRAIAKNKIKELHGFGEKTQARIETGLAHYQTYRQRTKLADAIPIADRLVNYLKQLASINQVIVAGSYRRRLETIGDLDILVTAHDIKPIGDHFIKFEETAEVLSHGPTRSTIRLRSGIQVDLRVVEEKSYGAALIYFTGSKAHNITIRKIAISKKLKINEYGVFKGEKYLLGRTEAEIYKKLNLEFIPPELREDRGEIAAAKNHSLPTLIELKDIRGDLHCHTKATDGRDSLEKMATKAEELGYEYLAITDHSQHLAMVRGFDKKSLLKQIKQIDQLNKKLKKLTILKSCEVDILEDGSLDLPDEVLAELDLTVCSIHSHFALSSKKQTERIIRAMDNPYCNILAHPTTRLINQREPLQIDLEKIILAAKDRNCILEINAQPDRCDLNDSNARLAKEMGVKLAVSTDSHNIEQLNYMQLGIYQARRAWLEKNDVINTRSLAEFKKLLQRK